MIVVVVSFDQSLFEINDVRMSMLSILGATLVIGCFTCHRFYGLSYVDTLVIGLCF